MAYPVLRVFSRFRIKCKEDHAPGDNIYIVWSSAEKIKVKK